MPAPCVTSSTTSTTSPPPSTRPSASRHPPPAGRPVRGRRLGALPPHRGPLRVPQPGRGDARQGGRADRSVVEGGRGVRRPPPGRPDHRAVLHPLPRPLPPPGRPPLLLLPPHVTPACPGGPGPRCAGLGHGGHHRATRRGGRGALRLGDGKLRTQPVRPGRPARLRLQLLR